MKNQGTVQDTLSDLRDELRKLNRVVSHVETKRTALASQEAYDQYHGLLMKQSALKERIATLKWVLR